MSFSGYLFTDCPLNVLFTNLSDNIYKIAFHLPGHTSENPNLLEYWYYPGSGEWYSDDDMTEECSDVIIDSSLFESDVEFHCDTTEAANISFDVFTIFSGPAITYGSHGPGTFNINPAGGIYGIYIGDEQLGNTMFSANRPAWSMYVTPGDFPDFSYYAPGQPSASDQDYRYYIAEDNREFPLRFEIDPANGEQQAFFVDSEHWQGKTVLREGGSATAHKFSTKKGSRGAAAITESSVASTLNLGACFLILPDSEPDNIPRYGHLITWLQEYVHKDSNNQVDRCGAFRFYADTSMGTCYIHTAGPGTGTSGWIGVADGTPSSAVDNNQPWCKGAVNRMWRLEWVSYPGSKDWYLVSTNAFPFTPIEPGE